MTDTLRAKFFATRKCERKTFKVNDIEFEIKKPLTGEVLSYTEGRTNEVGTRVLREMTVINFLIDFAYECGTDNKLFTEGDREALTLVPYTKEMQNIYQYILGALTGIDIGAAVKNLSETSLNKTV